MVYPPSELSDPDFWCKRDALTPRDEEDRLEPVLLLLPLLL